MAKRRFGKFLKRLGGKTSGKYQKKRRKKEKREQYAQANILRQRQTAEYETGKRDLAEEMARRGMAGTPQEQFLGEQMRQEYERGGLEISSRLREAEYARGAGRAEGQSQSLFQYAGQAAGAIMGNIAGQYSQPQTQTSGGFNIAQYSQGGGGGQQTPYFGGGQDWSIGGGGY